MYRTLIALFLIISVMSANADELLAIEEGTYSLNGRDGQPKHFTVERVEDRWEVKSADPSFPLRLVNCMTECDFHLMPESLQQKRLPVQFREMFLISCIANSGFALCKMMSKPLPECGNRAVKIGEACRLGPPTPTKPLYGLFALFAPSVMPITVTRLDAK